MGLLSFGESFTYVSFTIYLLDFLGQLYYTKHDREGLCEFQFFSYIFPCEYLGEITCKRKHLP